MDRYSLPRQSVSLISGASAAIIYLGSGTSSAHGVLGRIGLVLAFTLMGVAMGFLVPKPLIRWTLNQQAAIGGFLIAFLIMMLNFAGYLVLLLIPDYPRLSLADLAGGFFYYMIVGSFGALIGAAFAWYPTLATFLYLRSRRDYL